MRSRLLWLFAPLAILILLSEPALAAVPDNNAMDEFLDAFRAGFAARAVNIGALVTTLFYGLVLAEFVISAALMSVQAGGADIQSFTSFALKRFLVIGLFVFFLQQGSALASMIVGSFMAAGIAGGGPSLVPSDILDTGIRIAGDLNAAASWFTVDGLFTSIAGLIIVILFAMLTATMLVAMAEAFIVISSGVILLAFGGFSGTQDIAVAYFRYAIATGFKLMLMQIVAGIGIDIIEDWTDDLRNNGVEISAVIGTTLIMYTIAKEVPSIAADMIRGTTTGRMAVGEAAGQIARSTSNVASTMKSAATSMANSAGAMNQSVQSAKQGGASGAMSVAAGAVSALGKEVAADVGRSVRGAQGGGRGFIPGPAGGSMAQRVNNSLKEKNTANKSGGKS